MGFRLEELAIGNDAIAVGVHLQLAELPLWDRGKLGDEPLTFSVAERFSRRSPLTLVGAPVEIRTQDPLLTRRR